MLLCPASPVIVDLLVIFWNSLVTIKRKGCRHCFCFCFSCLFFLLIPGLDVEFGSLDTLGECPILTMIDIPHTHTQNIHTYIHTYINSREYNTRPGLVLTTGCIDHAYLFSNPCFWVNVLCLQLDVSFSSLCIIFTLFTSCLSPANLFCLSFASSFLSFWSDSLAFLSPPQSLLCSLSSPPWRLSNASRWPRCGHSRI